jgi:hypothetical protein
MQKGQIFAITHRMSYSNVRQRIARALLNQQDKLAEVRKIIQKHLPHLKKIILLALFYAALAFLYSSIGFLHPEVSHFYEYTGSRLFVEIFGHFAFGFIASLPFWDLEISLLTGAAAVLIDADHILSALNLNVSGRPDHSFFFVFVSAMILFYVVQRSNKFSKSFLIKFAFFAPVVVFSHISYDIFAVPLGSSSTFQLFIPFSFAEVTLPYNYWILFEVAALIFSFAGYLCAGRFGKNEESGSRMSKASEEMEKRNVREQQQSGEQLP